MTGAAGGAGWCYAWRTLGALIGGVAGGVLGSGILSGESDPNKPKRSDFPMGRAGGKAYSGIEKASVRDQPLHNQQLPKQLLRH